MSDIETGAEVEAPADDLRSALESAMQESSSTEPNSPADEGASERQAADRARHPDGKFAPKAADAAAGAKPTPPADAAHEGTAPAATQKTPVGWSGEEFAQVPPAIQAKILKREQDFARGFNERAGKVKFAEEFEHVATPHRDSFARRGVTPAQSFAILLNAQAALDRDPRAGIVAIAKSYGIDLSGIPQSAAQPHQGLSAAEQRIARVEAHLQAQARVEQDRHAQSITDEISKFAADPENKHFAAVEGRMAHLIEAKLATNIKDAYEQAIHLDPAIREQVYAERNAPGAKAARDQAAVTRARAAAGSVRGAPGSAVNSAPKPKDSLREELMAAAGL